MTLYCPLTGKTNVVLEKQIPSHLIIERYFEELNIDVSRYFRGIETVELYRCADTGYRFYNPSSLAGDDEFYQKLQKHKWYYEAWKWEYEVAQTFVEPKDHVLEIGCGTGEYLDRLRERGIDCVGLELNSNAIKIGIGKGLHIIGESIQDHAKENAEKYDLVCSFQVLEHITLVRDFIQSSITALRTGGRLIISVPNNDSLMFSKGKTMALNMPPHHMGLWNLNSLASLQNFGVRLKRVEFESLEKHRRFLEDEIQEELSAKMIEKYSVIGKALTPFAKRISNWTLSKIVKEVAGHTILVVYTKL